MTVPSGPDPGRAHRALEPLHSCVYFAPEAEEHYVAIGLRPGRMGYFASRSAPMGAVSAAVTTATFVNFQPGTVARHIPRAWTLASPDAVLAARHTVADLTLRRLLGDAVGSAEVREAAAAARDATTALGAEGRPLFAAHAALPWPDDPHLQLWHAVTLLREHRGDGHTMALTQAGLGGLDALVTHTATGRGFTPDAARLLRGWTVEEWRDAHARLERRGLLDGGRLTPAGAELRDAVERATDELAMAPWRHLGAAATARLTELGRGLSRTILGNGAFPPGVFAAR